MMLYPKIIHRIFKAAIVTEMKTMFLWIVAISCLIVLLQLIQLKVVNIIRNFFYISEKILF